MRSLKMSLEQILSKISEDVQLEAENIIRAASRQADEISDQIGKEASLLKDKIIATGRAEAEFIFRKETISKRLEAQKEILKVKKHQLDDCFREVLAALIDLDDNLYRNLINNLLAEIDNKQEAQIIFSDHDKSRISQDYIRKINPHLKLSFSDDLAGGFILKTKELNFDNTLANLLDGMRQELEPEVAEILFK